MLLGSFVEAYDEMEDDDDVLDPISPGYRTSYISDPHSNADQSSFHSPVQLPRSQTLHTQPGSSNNSEMRGYGERPKAGGHKQFKSH